MTPELAIALQSNAIGWIATALSTEPLAAERVVPAVHALYSAAGLKQPRVAIVSSPIAMAFAAGFAAAIWWARRNPVQAIGTGLAWASCHFPRQSPLQWTRQSIRSPMADDICRATELATQPYSEPIDLEGLVLGKGVTNRTFRDVASDATIDPAASRAIESAARGARDRAGIAVRQALSWEVVRSARERFVTPDAGALKAAAQADTFKIAALVEEYEGRTVKEAMRLLGEKGSTGDTPWGPFLPQQEAFYPGVAIDSILERQRESTRMALEAATQPADLLADVAMLAYDLGADNGVDHLLLLYCAMKASLRYQNGNADSALEGHLGAMCELLGRAPPQHEVFRAWETCVIEGSPRFVHDEFCIVSDRPAVLKVDDRGRPHGADEPSHRWRDGWGVHHWHGVHIPRGREYVIFAPEQITVTVIEAEFNVELRRVLIERYGAARYVTDSGATVVEELPADHQVIGLRSARLLRKDHVRGRRDEPIIFVDLLNSTPEPDGTVKRYLLRVDPNAYRGDASRYVHAAVASTWRNADGSLMFSDWRHYDPDAES